MRKIPQKRAKGLAHCHASCLRNLRVLRPGMVSLPRCTIDSYLEGSPLSNEYCQLGSGYCHGHDSFEPVSFGASVDNHHVGTTRS
jgi:hypothetical protein